MAKAGDYQTRLQWMKRTKSTADGYGDRKATDIYPSQGWLWCAIEDVAANRESRKEGERQVTSANVRLRNYPAIVAGDRLAGEHVWTVLTVTEGDNETICEVER